jgi:LAO/AO transport system kinase
MFRSLPKKILAGDIRALATTMTLIENADPRAEPILKSLYRHTGKAHVIGITGAAGTGKSSLIDRMTAQYRRRQKSVGVLAVDPSSLFSEGALLGDRIRMRAHFADRRVFIRSFASRGAGGGVAAAFRDAIHLLDAAGKDTILVETIGVGQDELDVAALVHRVIAVVIPEMGDEVQALKAGLAEIADIFVLNKADLPGADVTLQQLRTLFCDREIIATSAVHDQGIAQLVEIIEKDRVQSLGNGEFERKRLQLCRAELVSLLRHRLMAQMRRRIDEQMLDSTARRIANGRVDPYSEAEALARKIGF